MKLPYEEFDLSGVKTYPLRSRASKVTLAQFATPYQKGSGLDGLLESLPGLLAASDFAPFRALSDLPAGMTGHIVFEAIDPERPATASPEVIGVIRDEIGFDGLLMTDDLSMQALSGTIGERARDGIAAGCDLALHCNGVLSEMQDVVAAAGAMSGAAIRRGAAALACRARPEAVDMAALDAEFEALTKGAGRG